MMTINFRTVGRYIWTTLIILFHLIRIATIGLLGSIMAFYAMMFIQNEVGMIIMFIIIISMTDWLVSMYFGDWFKR